jgi:hypothetical protein
MSTSDKHCRRYVDRQLSPAVEANRLRKDIQNVEATLQLAERHAARIRGILDGLLAELVTFDD